MNKKLVIVSIIISIIIVITITLSSYAYFTMPNNKGEDNIVTSGTMSLHFTDGTQINANGLVPGQHIDKEFTVENTGTVQASYDIYLSEVINNFVDKTDLVYEIISIDGGYNTSNQIQVPSVPTKIINGQTIGVGDTHHYILRITFLNKDENQDDNQGVFFSAKVNINHYDDINTVVKYYLDNVEVAEIPNQSSSTYLSSNCNNNGTITFNENNWTYNTKIYQNNTTCNIYFISRVYEFTFDPDGDGLGQEQTFTVPKTGTYQLEVWGAEGGSAGSDSTIGGKGGYATGIRELNKDEVLYLNIGGRGLINSTTGGYNGGGGAYVLSASVASGGGATSVAYISGTIGTNLIEENENQILIIAGGGGGGGEINHIGGYANINPGCNNLGSVAMCGIKKLIIPNASATSANTANGAGGAGGGYKAINQMCGKTGCSGAGGGCFVNTSLLTNDLIMTGNQIFKGPSGIDETGHSGNGYAKITYISQ